MRFVSSTTSYKYQEKVLIQKQNSRAGKKSVQNAKVITGTMERFDAAAVADLTTGIAVFKKRVDKNKLIENLRAQKTDEAVNVIPWEQMPTDLDKLSVTQSVAMEGGANVAIKALKPPKDALRFDIKSPGVQNFINDNVGNLIVQMESDGRQAVKNVVTRSFEQGLTPRRAANVIQEVVGLTDRQSAIVMNRHLTLLNEKARLIDRLADLEDRGLTKSPSAITVRRNLKALSDDAIEKKLLQSAASQQRNRARTIARTEITRAVNAGQQEMWDQAANIGLISAQSEKVWVTVPDGDRTQICTDLDGERRKLDETFFVAQTGESVQAPPAHPNCRSSLSLEQLI